MSVTTANINAVPGPSTSTTSSLTPALFKRLHPQPYLARFLQERLRPDGRSLDDEDGAWREASINIGSISTAPSSALVRLGNTTVVCGITLEIAPPEMIRPTSGFIVPNVDLPALCHSNFRPGPPSDEAQVLSTRLREILLSSNYLPLETLCIEPSQAAWVIYIDVVCLNYDGGVLDASLLAAVAALRNLILPEATYDYDTLTTLCEPISELNPGERLKLSDNIPLCASFGIYENELLPDPTLFESQLCTSQATIALSPSTQRLLSVHQAGASTSSSTRTSREVLQECLVRARSRAKFLMNLLDES